MIWVKYLKYIVLTKLSLPLFFIDFFFSYKKEQGIMYTLCQTLHPWILLSIIDSICGSQEDFLLVGLLEGSLWLYFICIHSTWLNCFNMKKKPL